VLLTYEVASVVAKTAPNKAEAAGHGGSMFKADNAVWCGFRSNPSGTGRIFPIPSSLVASVRSVHCAPPSSASEKFSPVATAS
jgi:hypothetical protein